MAGSGLRAVPISGRIDANNAGEVEERLRAELGAEGASCTLDAEKLEYVSSAGLRVILRLLRDHPGLSIVNVPSGVYEVLEMTGFTQMLPVERALRRISVEGCEVIGRGANGSVYRIDPETVVKVFGPGTAQEDIYAEREKARLALILGLPTAISYAVVRVGDGLGSVFELLNARSFSQILSSEPERFEECASEYASLLKKIHTTEAPEGSLPGIKQGVLERAEYLRGVLEGAEFEKLTRLISSVPDANTLIHGDYHTKNILEQGGETLMIDMDTLSVGRPVFELGFIWNAFIGFYELDRDAVREFQGFDYETSERFFDRVLRLYLNTDCAHKIREVTDKARLVGLTRLAARAVRLGQGGSPEALHWIAELKELIAVTETLDFSEDDITLPAQRHCLEEALAFVGERAALLSPDERELKRLCVSCEEVFVNIADYAYPEGGGEVKLIVLTDAETRTVSVTLEDTGAEFDPLSHEDPDITVPAEARAIGGLGIFMAKRLTDGISYERRGGVNALTLVKKL